MSAAGGAKRLWNAARVAPALALVVVLVALAVRLDGLGARSFGHPENFNAGIPMPEWVPTNARRTDLAAVAEGMRTDGHPPLYFLFMLGWTALFGHGLVALRLPSALLGAASVLLVHRIALRVGSTKTAALAAALVALSGFHIYWSQLARPYLLASALGLASTLLLLRLRETSALLLAWGYGLTTAAALWTQLYAWPVVATQALWLAWLELRRRAVPAAVPALACALIAAAPVVAQLVLRARIAGSFWQEPWGYFALGHAFSSNVPFWGPTPEPPLPVGWLALATSVLVLLALLRPAQPQIVGGATGGIVARRAGWLLVGGLFALATVSSLAVWRYAVWVAAGEGGRPIVIACLLLPWIVAALTALVSFRRPALEGAATSPPRTVEREALHLVAAVALAPLLMMLALSLVKPALVERGTVVFVPYLLVLVAAGALSAARWRWPSVLTAGALLTLSLASLAHYRMAEATPRDYAGLAEELGRRLEPGDLVIASRDYRSPPLLYYFPADRWKQFQLTRDLTGLLGRRRPPRIWLVVWGESSDAEALWTELPGYRPAGEVVSRHMASAVLFDRDERSP